MDPPSPEDIIVYFKCCMSTLTLSHVETIPQFLENQLCKVVFNKVDPEEMNCNYLTDVSFFFIFSVL